RKDAEIQSVASQCAKQVQAGSKLADVITATIFDRGLSYSEAKAIEAATLTILVKTAKTPMRENKTPKKEADLNDPGGPTGPGDPTLSSDLRYAIQMLEQDGDPGAMAVATALRDLQATFQNGGLEELNSMTHMLLDAMQEAINQVRQQLN